MSDRRVEEYKILTSTKRGDLVEMVKGYIRLGFNDPLIGRWEPQGGPFVTTGVDYGTPVSYHQAMVRTKYDEHLN